MHRYAIGVLCSLAMLAAPLRGQKPTVEPIHVAAGTVLTFYLQTRLHPAHENAIDTLPRGTEIRVKILGSIDSSVDRDGAEFHGVLVAPIVSGYQVIVHAESEVRGMLVLLRSRNHPDGFRYEMAQQPRNLHQFLKHQQTHLEPTPLRRGSCHHPHLTEFRL